MEDIKGLSKEEWNEKLAEQVKQAAKIVGSTSTSWDPMLKEWEGLTKEEILKLYDLTLDSPKEEIHKVLEKIYRENNEKLN